MKSDAEVMAAYAPLYERFENMQRLLTNPPLLAHYTSIPVLEKILEEDTIWLSNPLFMNDLEEMRFGLNEGARQFFDHNRLKQAAGDEARAQRLGEAFQFFFSKFEAEGALDTYVFCLSEHEKGNTDGLLSMWRGYGGHGKGVAIIFNPANVQLIPNSILTLATVSYASTTARIEELNRMLNVWASATNAMSLPDDKLYLASFAALALLKTYALTTKHSGFSEEREWRLIYTAENDVAGLLKKFLGHHIGVRGVEPKLKLKMQPLPGVMSDDFSLSKVVEEIILGPSVSSPLAVQSMSRMLESIGKSQYKSRLRASSIPLRATE